MSWTLVKEVAAREILTRSRTQAFRIITGILVARGHHRPDSGCRVARQCR